MAGLRQPPAFLGLCIPFHGTSSPRVTPTTVETPRVMRSLGRLTSLSTKTMLCGTESAPSYYGLQSPRSNRRVANCASSCRGNSPYYDTGDASVVQKFQPRGVGRRKLGR
ncbi:hypothetical protein BDR05DRAFT_739940 [Suillus weaverae]|nr:hypothetical protein BDR05DRAFT_739940 [Suillus weaverae]